MSHLIRIAPTGEIEALDYDGTAPSRPQLLRALSSEGIAIDRLDAQRHTRHHHLTVWADDEAIRNDGRVNVTASAYAVTALIGTIVISGFNPETGDTVGLTADQAAEVRDQIDEADERISARFDVFLRLAHH
ncbi:hypothetical protein [Brachybacterium alimentarium]|uniref:hypothetical protein n=1 Tax=Brachybacterium alimentarium TaxID=47845 RepID=UPI003FD68274